MSTNPPPPDITLMQLAVAYRGSQVLHVAARLGLADLLKDGPKQSEELADLSGTFHPALHRLLLALVSYGILAQDAQGRFELTPSGVYLQSDHPQSVRAFVLFMTGETSWHSWENLEYSVKTGQSSFKLAYGMGLFEYNAQHQAVAQHFNEAMAALTATVTGLLLAAYDFSQLKLVVDIGGGNGSLLADILQAHPALQGITFDLPEVTLSAAKLLAQAGLAERCQALGGNFFQAVPGGGDVYLLKLILHDWDDAGAEGILKSCYRAMDPHARLLVLEQLQPEKVEPGVANQDLTGRDLNMLVTFGGGRERTTSEFQQLFQRSGFELAGVIPLSPRWNIIQARPQR